MNSNQYESSRQLHPLRSYREVQLFHYVVPPEVSEAKWRFNASNFYGSYLKSSLEPYSSHMQSIGVRSCGAQNLTVHLRRGSVPIININNASLPENLMTNDSQQYMIELKSDSSLVLFNITNPLPGDWYGLAFLDKGDDRISQKGLQIECQHKLTSSLSFKRFNQLWPNSAITVLTTTSSLVQNITHSSYYKFFMNSNCFSAKLVVSQCAQRTDPTEPLCPISLYSRALALPSHRINDLSINCSKPEVNRKECVLQMESLPTDSWNYLRIEPEFGYEANDENNSVAFELQLIIDQNIHCLNVASLGQTETSWEPSVITYSSPESANKTHSYIIDSSRPNIIGLTRYDTQNSLEFKYSHVDATELKPNQNISVFFDIPNDRTTLLQFGISPQSDIGGTLSIDFAISPFTNTSAQNYSTTLCLQSGRIGFFPDCLKEVKVNSSSPEFAQGSGIRTILMPYPRPGNWFITLQVECYLYYPEVDDEEYQRCETNVTSILLDIASAPCLHSKCANRGKCVQYLNGGVLFSSCSCKAGLASNAHTISPLFDWYGCHRLEGMVL